MTTVVCLNFLTNFILQKQMNVVNNFFGLTDVGRVRKQNQDFLFMNPDDGLFIIADGMGGHNGGAVASKMAVEHIVRLFKAAVDLNDTSIKDFLFSTIRSANTEIRAKAFSDHNLANMGTTIAIALIRKSILYACHVGDSRIYVINQTEIRQVGTDHSVIYQQVIDGELTREEARQSRIKNILTQAIGSRDQLVPEFNEVPLMPGDKILLSSDGLWNLLPDVEIQTLALSDENPEKVCDLLLDQAMNAGGDDNISVILFKN